MDPREHDQFVDELLDSALARYRSAEPRPGLEERLLGRLRAEPQPKAWLGWTWRLAAGVAVLGTVLLTVLLRRTVHITPGSPAPSSAVEARKMDSPPSRLKAAFVEPIAKSHPTRRASSYLTRQLRSQRIGEKPHKDVFPSPAPLSEQEKLLLRYVRENPAPVLVALQRATDALEEIRIEPLEMPPPLDPESDREESESNR